MVRGQRKTKQECWGRVFGGGVPEKGTSEQDLKEVRKCGCSQDTQKDFEIRKKVWL